MSLTLSTINIVVIFILSVFKKEDYGNRNLLYFVNHFHLINIYNL